MLISLLLATVMAPAAFPPDAGYLRATGREGPTGIFCPLKSTTVEAKVEGLGARVTVAQRFTNTSKEPIEAVYCFPLPADAAVDRMKMKVGDRLIVGEIKLREEARAVYEAAKRAGQMASLLDQERPNVFTQSVANIMPGADVEVEISYVQTLKFEDGEFEFSFPMVVGPRYNPIQTPDPERVSPPVVVPGKRTGTNVSLKLSIDAGAPIEQLKSVLHAIEVRKEGGNRTVVSLARKDEIPNRDFILRYRVKGEGVRDCFMTAPSPESGGTFCLMLMPPKTEKAEYVRPKEVIFVIDQSGSQMGFPIEKSKELTKELIRTLNPDDAFNIVTFSNSTRSLWPKPMPNAPEYVDRALSFVDSLSGAGGTEMLNAINLALKEPPAGERMRIVLFNTDGFVGNDFEILSAVRKYRDNGRMYTFGIGNGVNRFLIDAMAAESRGDSEIVTLAEEADAAVARFVQRTRSPILTDITVKIEGVPVTQVTPSQAPDVFSVKPVVVFGHYAQAGRGRVQIKGMLGGRPWQKTLEVNFPARGTDDSAVTTLWARRAIDDLMRADWEAVGTGKNRDLKTAVEHMGLRYGIMTQFTSFVAVEKRVVNVGGKQRLVNVPVELTEGVSYEGVFGPATAAQPMRVRATKASPGALGQGGGRTGGAVAGGVMGRNAGISYDSLSSSGIESDPYKAKVAKKLRDVATGEVEVQVRLDKLTDTVIEKLKEAGLKVDDKDAGLKVVFGRCDVAALKKLAKLDAVIAIDPLG